MYVNLLQGFCFFETVILIIIFQKPGVCKCTPLHFSANAHAMLIQLQRSRYIFRGLIELVFQIVDQIARAQHHALRLNGYLDFYKQTQLLHRSPLYVVSLINTTLMLLQGLMQHIYQDEFQNKCLKGGPFSPVGYLSIIISFEFFVIAVVSISYTCKYTFLYNLFQYDFLCSKKRVQLFCVREY